MKTLKAFGIAALVAATSTSAAFAAPWISDDDAASQTPFITSEASSSFSKGVTPATDGNAAVQTPFIVDDAAAVTRASNDLTLGDVSKSPVKYDEDDAAYQTPFVYAD